MRLKTYRPCDLIDQLEHALEWTPERLLSLMTAFYQGHTELIPHDEDEPYRLPDNTEPSDETFFVDQLYFLTELFLEILMDEKMTGLEHKIIHEGESYITALQRLNSRDLNYVLNGLSDLDENMVAPREELEAVRELLITWAYFFLAKDDDHDGFDGDDDGDDEPVWSPESPTHEWKLVGV